MCLKVAKPRAYMYKHKQTKANKIGIFFKDFERKKFVVTVFVSKLLSTLETMQHTLQSIRSVLTSCLLYFVFPPLLLIVLVTPTENLPKQSFVANADRPKGSLLGF